MSNRFGVTRSTAREWDIIGAAIGLVVALLLFPLQFFVSSIFLTTVPLVIGIASGLYLLTQRYQSAVEATDEWRLGADAGHIIRLVTLVGFGGIVFAATITGGRTPVFLGLSTLVSVLIFVQILFVQRHLLNPRLVLVQVVGLAMLVRGVGLLTTPGLVGVDAWVHISDYATAIAEAGQLSAIADTKHFSAPLYHLLVVVAGDAFSTPLRTALYATLGLVMPLVTLLVYYTSRLFIPLRWALFATAAYAVSDHVIRWGLHLIPTSMGLVFFIGVCYGIGRIYGSERPIALYGLVFLFGVATILTHQVSSFILLVFLLSGAVAQLYIWFSQRSAKLPSDGSSDRHVNFLGLLVVLLPLTLVNWSVAPATGTSFLRGMLELAGRRLTEAGFLNLASATTVDTGPISSLVTTVPGWVQIVSLLGFLMLLLVALLGSFALLQRQRFELLSVSWVNATAVMLVVTLGLPLLGLYFLLPNRWFAFMYLFMVIIGAHGLRYLELNVSPRYFVAVLVAFLLLFTGPMLVNEHATRDDPAFEEYHIQFAYSDAELDAAQTIGALHPDDATLHTDHPYRLLLRDWQHESTDKLTLSTAGQTTGEYVVYREAQASDATLISFGGESVLANLSPENVCRPSMDVVYSNGEVTYCSGGAR